MKKLKNISKRSAILLLCMVMLFGTLFIPVSAKEICEHVSGYQHPIFTYNCGPSMQYCSWTLMTVIWKDCCGTVAYTEILNTKPHQWKLGGSKHVYCPVCLLEGD